MNRKEHHQAWRLKVTR